MAGKALPEFQDFVLATNERKVTSPTDILSEAARNTYLFGRMMDGYDPDITIQGGSTITDRMQFDKGAGFAFYQPNETFSPQIEDLLTGITANWRFAKDNYAWTDHEIELQAGTGPDRGVKFVDLKKSKQQGCIISLYEGIEDALWATPDNAQMESANGKRPYSIRAFITEDGLLPAGFTTLLGKADHVKWRNQVATYDSATPDTTLQAAFEAMWFKLRWVSPKPGSDAWKETKWRKFCISTDTQGAALYVRLTRDANDNPVAAPGGKDLGWAVNSPTFGGIPVEQISALDDVGYANGHPRYFWKNFQYLHPVMHSKRYMYETDPIHGGATQPYSWVVYKDCWYNLVCRSRRRQGIIVPT